jgi:hypothetical protein
VPYSCESSIAAWLAVATSLFVFRALILLLVWYAWYLQNYKKPSGGSSSNADSVRKRRAVRFPLVPFFSTVDTVLIGLMILLASLNLVSAPKGNSLLMYSSWIFSVCCIQFATLRKMVALGLRMFRFDMEESHSHHAEGIRALASFDDLLKALVVVRGLSCVGPSRTDTLNSSWFSCSASRLLAPLPRLQWAERTTAPSPG